MASIIPHDKNRLFQFEILQARLAIRELFLKTMVREIYDNIGQVLSLVRLQLNTLKYEADEISTENLNISGDLVGQSLRDLRHMSRHLFPDLELQKEGGLINFLETNLKIIGHELEEAISKAGIEQPMSHGLSLIVFNIIQDLFIEIKQIKGKITTVNLHYKAETVIFDIAYKGVDMNWEIVGNKIPSEEFLGLQDRITLIGGDIQFEKRKSGIIHIIFTTPLNYITNEK